MFAKNNLFFTILASLAKKHTTKDNKLPQRIVTSKAHVKTFLCAARMSKNETNFDKKKNARTDQ